MLQPNRGYPSEDALAAEQLPEGGPGEAELFHHRLVGVGDEHDLERSAHRGDSSGTLRPVPGSGAV